MGWEELVDEAGEHDVAGEVESVGGRRRRGVGGWHCLILLGRGDGLSRSLHAIVYLVVIYIVGLALEYCLRCFKRKVWIYILLQISS